jgi:hypothetical protein
MYISFAIFVAAKSTIFMNPNQIKTEKVVLYIANKMKDKPKYGAVVLNKALYFIDNVAYLKFGKSISSFSYIKQDQGPTPNPKEFMPLIDQLTKSGKLTKHSKYYFGRTQYKCIAEQMPELDGDFTADEVALMDEVLESIENMNATELSEHSHTYIAWKAATKMETIPLYSFLLTARQPTEAEILWAKSYFN